MSGFQLLQDKHALVFGAAGTIGAAVAKEFAKQGAEVFLAGRSLSTVEELARHVVDAGGRAHAAAVDCLNDDAVQKYVDDVAKRAGTVDVLVDLTGPRAQAYGNGKNAVDLSTSSWCRSTPW